MTRTPIVDWDIDEARYYGDGEDGVYYQVAQGPDGWYVTTVVDCNSSSFVDTIHTDDGPYETEADAWEAGRGVGVDWCIDNDVIRDEDDTEER